MAMLDTSDVPLVSLSNIPATTQQRRVVLTVAVALLVAFGISAPLADAQFPRYDGYLPAIESMVFVNDLITAILLLAHYSISPSRSILALACGYLYTALIVIPHMLTFPGAFTDTGLLGAGPQTSAWLYYLWGAGPPAGAIAYAILRRNDQGVGAIQRSTRSAICWSVALVACLALGITWITTAQNQILPTIVGGGDHYVNAVAYVASPLAILFMVIAIAMLWAGRRSVLDYWLMLAIFALILQHIYGGFLATGRYTLGFYASRGFTLVTSILVLGLLLKETANLYARLARSNLLLERERNNKLMNLEIMSASIIHEISQPLGAISLNSETAILLLGKKPFDPKEARETLGQIGQDCARVMSTVRGMRALFKRQRSAETWCNVNHAINDALMLERNELSGRGVQVEKALDRSIPPLRVDAHQLQQVLLNLIANAADAMSTVTDRKRILRVTSEVKDSNVVLSVQDTGAGITHEHMEKIFEPMFTTKGAGMGMGLWICRAIVESYGGQLKAWSRLNSGSIFQIVLPMEKSGVAAAETDAKAVRG
jgi:signal transduction histidine kinase